MLPITAIATLHQGLHHDFLEVNEERRLLMLAQQGDNEAIDILIAHCERLIFRIAEFYFKCGSCGDSELVDLQQYGRIGAMKAIKKFDTNSGNRFTTYATYWIRAYVRRYGMSLGNQVSMSYSSNDKKRMIKAAAWKMRNALEREPTDEEVANQVHMSIKVVKQFRSLSVISFDDTAKDQNRKGGEGPCSMLENFIQDDSQNTSEIGDGEILFTQAEKAISQLPYNWQIVVVFRFGLAGHEKKTIRALGKMLGITGTRVQQIEKLAIAKLTEIMGASPA